MWKEIKIDLGHYLSVWMSKVDLSKLCDEDELSLCVNGDIITEGSRVVTFCLVEDHVVRMDSRDCQGFTEFRGYPDLVGVGCVPDSISVCMLRTSAIYSVYDVKSVGHQRVEHDEQRQTREEIQ